MDCSGSPRLYGASGWHVGWTAETEHELNAVGEVMLPRPGRWDTLYVGKQADRPDLAMALDVKHGGFTDAVLVWLTVEDKLSDCIVT